MSAVVQALRAWADQSRAEAEDLLSRAERCTAEAAELTRRAQVATEDVAEVERAIRMLEIGLSYMSPDVKASRSDEGTGEGPDDRSEAATRRGVAGAGQAGELDPPGLASPSFWPAVGTDPVLDVVYRVRGYDRSELPGTALEFLDCLREIGYSVGQEKDLDLQDTSGVGLGLGLDGNPDKLVGPRVSVAVDVPLDGKGSVDRLHEDSSRSDEGAGTPDDRTVGDAPDTPSGAGPAGDSRPRPVLDVGGDA